MRACVCVHVHVLVWRGDLGRCGGDSLAGGGDGCGRVVARAWHRCGVEAVRGQQMVMGYEVQSLSDYIQV